MTLINSAELARKINVSKPAISKAVKEGRIFYEKDKLFNLDDPEIQNYISNIGKRKSRKKINKITFLKQEIIKEKKKKPIATVRKPGVKKKQKIKEEKPDFEKKIDEVAERMLQKEEENHKKRLDNDYDQLDKIKLECEKKTEEIQKLRIENGKKRGDLIERDLIRRVFSKLGSIDKNQFLQLPDVLMSKITVAAGIDSAETKLKISKIITNDLYKVQKHIQRELADALNGMEKMGD